MTLGDLAEAGMRPAQVFALLGASLGLCELNDAVTAGELVPRFAFATVPRQPWFPVAGGL